MKNSIISVNDFEKGMKFDEYFKYVEVESNNPSSDVNKKYQSYIQQNFARMKRLRRKEIVLDQSSLSDASRNLKIKVVVLTEAWCGDASQILPIAYNFFQNFPYAEVRFFLRDENEQLMNHFLTNNSKSIPIIALFDNNLSLLDFWGPRPVQAQELYQQLRDEALPMDQLLYHLHKWYSDDKGISTIEEIKQMVDHLLVRFV